MRLHFCSHRPFADDFIPEPILTEKLRWFVDQMKSMTSPQPFRECYYKLLGVLDDNTDQDYFKALGTLFMLPVEEFSEEKAAEIMQKNPRSFGYFKEKFLAKEENPDFEKVHALAGLACAIGRFNCQMLDREV
jgi:hypothetical protein